MRCQMGAILTGNGLWRLAQDIDNAGHRDVKIVIKSDQEVAMVALGDQAQKLRNANSSSVKSPVGESGCNGRVQKAIRVIQDKARILKSQVEHHAKVNLNKKFPLTTWIARWPGKLVTNYHVGRNGKTTYRHEFVHLRACSRLIAKFGGYIW